jgi:hypothetical protein
METASMSINLPSNIQMNKKQFQKMLFIMNALSDGWSIKKSQDTYIFTKKHENRREIFQENYLENFVIQNATTTDILSEP